MNRPGTLPPKVQNVYLTPSAISLTTSRTSSSTTTLAGLVRWVGGGTSGAWVGSDLIVSIAVSAFSTGTSVVDGPRQPAVPKAIIEVRTRPERIIDVSLPASIASTRSGPWLVERTI